MKYVSLFIALLILSHPLLPVAEYAVNYDYISEVLCINKEEAQLDCHGKCHLAKEIAKERNDDSKKNTSSHSSPLELTFIKEDFPSSPTWEPLTKEHSHSFYFKERLHSTLYEKVATQPPQVFA